ncbi:MAG TPA: hypothetical protein V6C65_36510, partial [Allocoleopsis sp.]
MNKWRVVLVVVIVVVVNFGIWDFCNRPVKSEAWQGMIKAVAFTPYQKDQSPLEGQHPTLAQMDHDLQLVSHFSKHIRTYTTADGHDRIPKIAAKYGITVTAGAWIEGNPQRDRLQIEALIKTAQSNRNVTSVIVGNEAILREQVSPDQMVAYLNEVRQRLKTSVSTAEIWQNWLKYPQLAAASDYLAIHILPYWEGIPVDQAVQYVLDAYGQVKQAYPNKPIVISEVGWPSEGAWVKGAEPSLVNQAAFLRHFLNVARQQKLNY